MDNEFLSTLGFDFYKPKDFSSKRVTLRDGRDASLWINNKSGHGILDKKFWVNEKFYQEEYRKEFSADKRGSYQSCKDHLKVYEKLNNHQFSFFKELLKPSSKYLEIGCSFGGVLSRVYKHGVAECHAIEPNTEDSDFVKSQHQDVKIFNQCLGSCGLLENHYDIIVAFDVLEHVFDVGSGFLAKCFQALKPGGRIILGVPNHNNILLTTYKSEFYKKFYYHKAHVNYFTSQSLIDLTSHYGFIGEASSFLDYSFFNHVYWSQNDSPMNSALGAFSPEPCNTTDLGKDINEFYLFVERAYENLVNSRKAGGALIYSGIKTV